MELAGGERGRMIQLPRCPYCHEDVPRGRLELRVCSRCHAFHHDACWSEAGGCSACAPVVKITVPAEPVAPDPAPAHGVALEPAPGSVEHYARTLPSLAERIAEARRRGLRIAAVGSVLLGGALALAWLWGVATRPSYHDDPARAVQTYFEIYAQTRSKFERHSPALDGLSTPLSRELASMERGRFDEPLTEPTSSSEVSLRALTNEPVAARVTAGSRAFRLLPVGSGGWQLDRTLAETPTAALGVRLRLPLGLERLSERLEWQQGELGCGLARQTLGASLAQTPLGPAVGDTPLVERTIGVLQLESGAGPLASGTRRDDLPPKRLGAATRVFAGESTSESAAIGYVEVAPGAVVSIELRAPAGHSDALVQLLRASLGTLEFYPEAASDPVGWTSVVLDARSTLRVPSDFGRAGERLEPLQVFEREGPAAIRLDDVLAQARRPHGSLHTRHDTAGLLSRREVFLVPTLDEGKTVSESWVLVAAGVFQGRGEVLTLSAPAGRLRSQAALERLERIADTFALDVGVQKR